MARYRECLPQLSGDLFLTDGGLETTLIFHQNLELPAFAAFDLLRRDGGRETLRDYFRTYAEIARRHGVGFILESATWRANPSWGATLGYSTETLAEINREAIGLLGGIRDEYETEQTRMVISGCIGPRGDGYDPADPTTVEEAERFHATQIRAFVETDADMVTALTLSRVEEAIGITRASRSADLPVVISFTVETDGNLPSGQTLKRAIESVDSATDGAPAYYMINCAHPTHFDDALETRTAWCSRIRGIRANASVKSHAELDEAEDLDAGDPEELGRQYGELRGKLRNLNVLGGCCGTDHHHIERIYAACADR